MKVAYTALLKINNNPDYGQDECDCIAGALLPEKPKVNEGPASGIYAAIGKIEPDSEKGIYRRKYIKVIGAQTALLDSVVFEC